LAVEGKEAVEYVYGDERHKYGQDDVALSPNTLRLMPGAGGTEQDQYCEYYQPEKKSSRIHATISQCLMDVFQFGGEYRVVVAPKLKYTPVNPLIGHPTHSSATILLSLLSQFRPTSPVKP